MSSEESIRPAPYSPDLTPTEEHLRMSRIVQQARDWLGNTPWSDSEAAERDYGWPTPPSTRPNLSGAGDRGYILFRNLKEEDGNGDIINMRTRSLWVETIEELEALKELSDEEFDAICIGRAAIAAAVQEEQ